MKSKRIMKKYGNLYDKVTGVENLKLADKKARKGKLKSYGVIEHDKNRENNISNLHYQLVNKTFKTSKYNIFKIYEPKEREIYRLPYFPDRILHHAIMNIMEPIWMSVFTSDSYSCIKGRGIHGLFYKLKHDLKDTEGTIYCLKMDVKKFYPSIDHQILKSIVAKKIKDESLLNLLYEIIDSAPGIPIGNYLSQYFANLYLSYFDHWIKEHLMIKYYYRYADDMVILSSNKNCLHAYLKEIQHYLSCELNLSLKNNYQIFPVDKRGIDYIGYVFYHSHILMRKSIKKRFARSVFRSRKRSYSSYYGWAIHCNSINLLKKLAS